MPMDKGELNKFPTASQQNKSQCTVWFHTQLVRCSKGTQGFSRRYGLSKQFLCQWQGSLQMEFLWGICCIVKREPVQIDSGICSAAEVTMEYPWPTIWLVQGHYFYCFCSTWHGFWCIKKCVNWVITSIWKMMTCFSLVMFCLTGQDIGASFL